ncbi:hypothetical protein EMPS_00752 [Entomortierella parvispora]|uniref:Uncharacterized protein n=1 Tax=Entomortierella parvispora TaxID=205924 RepID=A0A9P3H1I8_9FUNG|nr:hypothetical protein EMPS_00752 [Entomortierella parvispora]
MDSVHKLKVSFHGNKKCYLVYHSIVNCECEICEEWTRYEVIEYPDNRYSYGAIPLESAGQVRTFDICQNQELRIKLVPWSRRNNSQLNEDTLVVMGCNRSTILKDSLKVDGEVCGVSLEKFLPEDALAKAFGRTLDRRMINQ